MLKSREVGPAACADSRGGTPALVPSRAGPVAAVAALAMELRYGLERLIHVRVLEVLTIVVAVSFLAGCGDQGDPGPTRDQSGIAGRVHLGPQCPVEIVDDPCADKPAAGSKVTVAKQLPGDSYAGGEVVARTTTDADGTYRVTVAPGNYVVTADAGMSCELMDARVTAGAYSMVEIPCDTGIR